MFKANNQLWSSCKNTPCTQARQFLFSRTNAGSIRRIPFLSSNFIKKLVRMKKIPQRLDICHHCRSQENHATPLRTAVAEGPKVSALE